MITRPYRAAKRDGWIFGGATLIKAVDRSTIEELADHPADAGFGIADRMAVVANYDVATLRQTAKDFVAAGWGRHRIQAGSLSQRATSARHASSPERACVSGIAIDAGTMPFIETARSPFG